MLSREASLWIFTATRMLHSGAFIHRMAYQAVIRGSGLEEAGF